MRFEPTLLCGTVARVEGSKLIQNIVFGFELNQNMIIFNIFIQIIGGFIFMWRRLKLWVNFIQCAKYLANGTFWNYSLIESTEPTFIIVQCLLVDLICSRFLSSTVSSFSSFRWLVVWGWSLRTDSVVAPFAWLTIFHNNDNNNNKTKIWRWGILCSSTCIASATMIEWTK